MTIFINNQPINRQLGSSSLAKTCGSSATMPSKNQRISELGGVQKETTSVRNILPVSQLPTCCSPHDWHPLRGSRAPPVLQLPQKTAQVSVGRAICAGLRLLSCSRQGRLGPGSLPYRASWLQHSVAPAPCVPTQQLSCPVLPAAGAVLPGLQPPQPKESQDRRQEEQCQPGQVNKGPLAQAGSPRGSPSPTE